MNHLLDKNKYTKDSEPSPFSELNGPFYTQVINDRIYKGFEVSKKNRYNLRIKMKDFIYFLA